MANLATSAVTLNRDWFAGLQRNVRCKDVTLVLAAMGTTTNKIPATALGLTKILGGCVLVKSDDSEIIHGVADYTGDNLLLQATGVTFDTPDYIVTSAPADYTGTYRGVITGI